MNQTACDRLTSSEMVSFESKAKTALVFGVTGQDGVYLSELLLSKGYKVVGVARRASTPNDYRIRHLYANPNFRVLQGDITDAHSVSNIINGAAPEEIYNLAAQSHVGTSFQQPAYTMAATFGGVLNILEAIRSLGLTKRTRVYQASSSEMFGSSFSLPRNYDQYEVVEHFDFNKQTIEEIWAAEWICRVGKEKGLEFLKRSLEQFGAGSEVYPFPYQDENTPFAPNSPYAVAKLAAHNLCRIYREAYGMFISCGILYNHESVRRSEEFVTKKIAKYVAKYQKNPNSAPLKLGNLDSYRDWGFAGDYVQAMHIMLQQDKPDDFVISTGETHSVRDFLIEAFSVIGVNAEDALNAVQIDPGLLRPCEVPYLRGDSTKAKKTLGWEPKVPFKQLVESMVLYEIESLNKKGEENV